MTEQVFFYLVISIITFFGLLNFFLDLKTTKKLINGMNETTERISNIWSQIERIDDGFTIINKDLIEKDKKINDIYNELKKDILFWEKQRDEMFEKYKFENDVTMNRLNSHSKKIVYIKKVLDKLFDHKVEIRHKAKLVKLEGELEKW